MILPGQRLDLTHYIYGGKGENAFGLGDRKGNKRSSLGDDLGVELRY